jgi:hypothetical protein
VRVSNGGGVELQIISYCYVFCARIGKMFNKGN